MRSAAVVLVFAAAMVISCARNKKPLEEPKPAPGQPNFEATAEPVVLHAVALKNKVYIQVTNNGLTLLRVSPYHFGIIVKKRLTIYDPKTALSQFPSALLKKGEQASGYMTFYGIESLAGQKLVFNNPDYKPIVTVIETATAPPQESAPPSPEEATPAIPAPTTPEPDSSKP